MTLPSAVGDTCDDTVVHACYVTNSIVVTLCVYAVALFALYRLFWRFRWWPISKLRARRERTYAEVKARHAREAEEGPSEDPPPRIDRRA